MRHTVTDVSNVRISTVLLPFPHMGGQYETCVFLLNSEGSSIESNVVNRYETWDKALEGHERIVKHFRSKLSLGERIVDSIVNFLDF